MRSRSKRRRLFLGIGLLATAIALAAYAGHLLRKVEATSIDTRFSIRGPTGALKDVVLVAIDNKTNRFFTDHKTPVLGVAYSPDGKTFAVSGFDVAGGSDGEVAFWATTGVDYSKVETVGSGRQTHFRGVAYSCKGSDPRRWGGPQECPDGSTVAAAGADGKVVLWDALDYYTELGAISDKRQPRVFGLAFSPDGGTLATVGDGKEVLLWDAAHGYASADVLDSGQPRVFGVAYSPDGSTLATAGGDGKVVLWDVAQNYKKLASLDSGQKSVQAVAFSPDGDTLVAGGSEGKVVFWDAAQGYTKLAARASGTTAVRGVAFNPDGSALAVAGGDGNVDLWDPADKYARIFKLNTAIQWPYPRRYHARVIDRIAAGKPKAIGVDIEFIDPTSILDDNALIESVQRAGDVILSATEVDKNGNTNVFGGAAKQFGAHPAATNVTLDPDGVVRRMDESVQRLTTFGVAAAAVAQGKKVPRAPTGVHWIDYAGPPKTVKTYSYVDVLLGNAPPGAFRGKVVVIGAPVEFLQDAFATPTTDEMSGPEVQANIIETVLRGYPLRSVPVWLNTVLIILLGMLPVLSIRLGALKSLGIALVAGGAFALAVQFAFNHGKIVAFIYPLLALALSAVGSLVVWYILEAFDRAMTRDVFARFVPEAVVSQVLARTGGDLRLGGEKVFGTAMFTDLRGFTTFSEGHEATEVIGLLNTYLASMSDAVLAHGGTLVTYTGDGLMAVFGAPLPQDDHADRALAAAREMLEVRLPAFNKWLHEEGHEYEFKMGVGLNSGDFMSGNVGSERRLEYTAIGDTINTASRIEGMTKGTPQALYFAGSTRDALTDPPDDLVFIDEMAVRGRAHGIPIWSLSSELIRKENWESEIAKPAASEPAAPASV